MHSAEPTSICAYVRTHVHMYIASSSTHKHTHTHSTKPSLAFTKRTHAHRHSICGTRWTNPNRNPLPQLLIIGMRAVPSDTLVHQPVTTCNQEAVHHIWIDPANIFNGKACVLRHNYCKINSGKLQYWRHHVINRSFGSAAA